ncbi:MAG: 6-bladed beta-propeller [Bacteroidales bacterium]|nr:6-bladed beta-propeller [Bacteroidales bacterium]
MLSKSYTRALIALFLPLVVIVAFGCSNANTGSSMLQEGLKEIVLANVEERDLLFPNNLPDSSRFIPLETNDECLIESIRKVVIADSLIFVQDANSRILLFDLNGKFKRQIGSQGRGVGEYHYIKSFYVDSLRNQIVLVNIGQDNLLAYNYNGEFLQDINLGERITKSSWGVDSTIFDYSESFMGIEMVNDSCAVVLHDLYQDFDYHFTVLNLNTMKVVGGVKQEFEFSSLQGSAAGMYFSSAETPYFCVDYSDTIYRYVAPYTFEPAYLITSSKKRLNRETLNSWRGLQTYDFFRRVSSEGYSRGVLLMQASDSHLLLHCMDGDYQYRVVVDLHDNSVTKTNLSFFAETDRAYLPFSFQSTYGDGFVAVIKPTDMIECVDDEFVKGHAELNSICATLKEDDNPIIGIYYIKK